MTDTAALIERLRSESIDMTGLNPPRVRGLLREAADALTALTRDPNTVAYWIQAHDEKEARADAAEAALAEIVKTADDAWQAVDDWDDTGGHVGVGRHERAKADGLSVAAGIARAALAGEAT